MHYTDINRQLQNFSEQTLSHFLSCFFFKSINNAAKYRLNVHIWWFIISLAYSKTGKNVNNKFEFS